MKFPIVLCAAMVSLTFMACKNSKTKPDQPVAPSVNNDIKIPGKNNPGNFDFDAIIIGKGVRSRENHDTKSQVIRTFEPGELVRLLDVKQGRISLSNNDPCSNLGYEWYSVLDQSGKSSWVFGQFIYKLVKECEYTITFDNKIYCLVSAYDQSYGTSDENGLTGCDEMFVPVLYEKPTPGNAMADLIYCPKGTDPGDLDWKATESGIMQLVGSSEGGSDEITSVEVKSWKGKETIVMNLTFYYQDASQNSTVYIQKVQDKFNVIHVEKFGRE